MEFLDVHEQADLHSSSTQNEDSKRVNEDQRILEISLYLHIYLLAIRLVCNIWNISGLVAHRTSCNFEMGPREIFFLTDNFMSCIDWVQAPTHGQCLTRREMHPQHVRVIVLLSLDHGCIFLADVENQQMIPMTHISMTYTIWKQVMDCSFFNLGPFLHYSQGP